MYNELHYKKESAGWNERMNDFLSVMKREQFELGAGSQTEKTASDNRKARAKGFHLLLKYRYCISNHHQCLCLIKLKEAKTIDRH